jgi:hypothetical protein
MRVSVSTSLLRLALGAFFVILGLYGVLPNVEESVFSLRGQPQWVESVFGLIELACGAFLVVSVFVGQRQKLMSNITLAVLVLWLLRVLLTKFLWGLSFTDEGLIFHPGFATWLLVLCCELVVASSLAILHRAYKS